MSPIDDQYREAIHQSMNRMNRSLWYSAANKTNALGRTWGATMGEAMPISDVDRMVQWLAACGNEISHDRALCKKLITLYQQVDRVYNKPEESEAKEDVLKLIDRTLNKYFAALMLEDIEKKLPEGQFAPFRRDSQGSYIDPVKQLHHFKWMISPEDRLITVDDYLRKAKETIDSELRLLRAPLPPQLKEGNNWKEIADFYNAQNKGLAVFQKIIPIEVANLEGLQKLSFDDLNTIDFLPAPLEKLTNLEELNLKGTRLRTPQELIYRLPALRKLSAYFLPELHRLPQLTALDLTLNLPEVDFTHNKKLEVLSLEMCSLTKLPPTITVLTNLRELNLDVNDLKIIPEIEFLSKLEKLNVRNNPNLVEIPIGRLHNLKELICDPKHLKLITFSTEEVKQLQLERIYYPNAAPGGGPPVIILWEKTEGGQSLTDFLNAHKTPGEKMA